MKVPQKEEHEETPVDKGEDKRNADKENLEQINASRTILLIAVNILLQHALLRVDNSLFQNWWQQTVAVRLHTGGSGGSINLKLYVSLPGLSTDFVTVQLYSSSPIP